MSQFAARSIETPVGWLRIEAENDRLQRINWGHGPAAASPVLDEAVSQIRAYFDGAREAFDLPVALPDAGFRRDFLQSLIKIPFGQTVTYGDLARQLGVSAQAIGQACGANPLPIVIPCHRVLAHSGLGGYSGAGGIETKVALLRHEGAAGLLL